MTAHNLMTETELLQHPHQESDFARYLKAAPVDQISINSQSLVNLIVCTLVQKLLFTQYFLTLWFLIVIIKTINDTQKCLCHLLHLRK